MSFSGSSFSPCWRTSAQSLAASVLAEKGMRLSTARDEVVQARNKRPVADVTMGHPIRRQNIASGTP
jgi:hypothetical protein